MYNNQGPSFNQGPSGNGPNINMGCGPNQQQPYQHDQQPFGQQGQGGPQMNGSHGGPGPPGNGPNRGPQQNGPYGGPPNQGPCNGPPQNRPYNGPPQNGPCGGPPNQGLYNGRPQNGPYNGQGNNGPPNQGPYNGPPNQGPYNGPPNQGQYNGPPNQGQYNGPPNQGPYNGPPNQRQYNGPPNQGPNSGPPNQGQNNGPPNQGQYNGPPNQGQYNGPPNRGQYNGPNQQQGPPQNGPCGGPPSRGPNNGPQQNGPPQNRPCNGPAQSGPYNGPPQTVRSEPSGQYSGPCGTQGNGPGGPYNGPAQSGPQQSRNYDGPANTGSQGGPLQNYGSPQLGRPNRGPPNDQRFENRPCDGPQPNTQCRSHSQERPPHDRPPQNGPYGGPSNTCGGPPPNAPVFAMNQQNRGQNGPPGEPPNSGPRGGPPNNQPCGGPPPNSGPRGGPPNSGPCGGPPNSGPYGGPPNSGPCGGPPNNQPCGGPPNSGPCGGSPNGGPCGGPPNNGPYGGPPNNGPCGGPPNSGPYGAPPNNGPHGGPSNNGPCGGPPNNGPYGGPPNNRPSGGPPTRALNDGPSGGPLHNGPNGGPLHNGPKGGPLHNGPNGGPLHNGPNGGPLNSGPYHGPTNNEPCVRPPDNRPCGGPPNNGPDGGPPNSGPYCGPPNQRPYREPPNNGPGGGPPNSGPCGGPPNNQPCGGPLNSGPRGGPPNNGPCGGPPNNQPCGGPPNSGPCGRPPNNGPCGGPPNNGPRGGPPNNGPYGGPRNNEPCGGPPNNGPSGGPPNNGPCGGPQNSGPCEGPPNNGPCGRPPNNGPCGGPPNNGPCGGPPNNRPSGGPPNNGPCGGPLNNGPSGGPPNNGPSGGPSNSGPYGGPPNNGPCGGPPNNGPCGGPPNNGPCGRPPNNGPCGGPPNNGPYQVRGPPQGQPFRDGLNRPDGCPPQNVSHPPGGPQGPPHDQGHQGIPNGPRPPMPVGGHAPNDGHIRSHSNDRGQQPGGPQNYGPQGNRPPPGQNVDGPQQNSRPPEMASQVMDASGPNWRGPPDQQPNYPGPPRHDAPLGPRGPPPGCDGPPGAAGPQQGRYEQPPGPRGIPTGCDGPPPGGPPGPMPTGQRFDAPLGPRGPPPGADFPPGNFNQQENRNHWFDGPPGPRGPPPGSDGPPPRFEDPQNYHGPSGAGGGQGPWPNQDQTQRNENWQGEPGFAPQGPDERPPPPGCDQDRDLGPNQGWQPGGTIHINPNFHRDNQDIHQDNRVNLEEFHPDSGPHPDESLGDKFQSERFQERGTESPNFEHSSERPRFQETGFESPNFEHAGERPRFQETGFESPNFEHSVERPRFQESGFESPNFEHVNSGDQNLYQPVSPENWRSNPTTDWSLPPPLRGSPHRRSQRSRWSPTRSPPRHRRSSPGSPRGSPPRSDWSPPRRASLDVHLTRPRYSRWESPSREGRVSPSWSPRRSPRRRSPSLSPTRGHRNRDFRGNKSDDGCYWDKKRCEGGSDPEARSRSRYKHDEGRPRERRDDRFSDTRNTSPHFRQEYDQGKAPRYFRKDLMERGRSSGDEARRVRSHERLPSRLDDRKRKRDGESSTRPPGQERSELLHKRSRQEDRNIGQNSGSPRMRDPGPDQSRNREPIPDLSREKQIMKVGPYNNPGVNRPRCPGADPNIPSTSTSTKEKGVESRQNLNPKVTDSPGGKSPDPPDSDGSFSYAPSPILDGEEEEEEEDECVADPSWIRCSPADLYFKQDDKLGCVKGLKKMVDLENKFERELVKRGTEAFAKKPVYKTPEFRPNVNLRCHHHDDGSGSCSSSCDSDDDEEDLHWMDELNKRKEHPYHLHDDLWFNEPGEMNDGPLCRCSLRARRSGIRHSIYPGEDNLKSCNQAASNTNNLYHYRITMSPHTNFLTKNPTVIEHDDHEYIFDGFSVFSHYKLDNIPLCKVIRFNIEYTIHFFDEPMPVNFTTRSLDLFTDYLFSEILEFLDLDWYGTQSDMKGCKRFHLMPRFVRSLPENGREILSMNEILNFLRKAAAPVVHPKDYEKIHNLEQHEWQEFVDQIRGMIVTFPGMKPSSIRVDQLDRNTEGAPVIVHFGIKPAQLSYAGDPNYQKLWKQYAKYKHLLANKPKVTAEDKMKLKEKEDKLQEIRMKSTMKREVTVEISSEGFIKTGIKSDMCQHAMLLPVLISHLRFHRSLDVLERQIDYRFKDRNLLQRALTHPSYRVNYGTNPDHARNSLSNCGIRQPEFGDRHIHHVHSRKRGINTLINIMSRMGNKQETDSEIHHYERLEFLGDAVVEFITSIHLFFMFPDLDEGGLATFRAALVQNQHLSVLAKTLHLQDYMLYAHGPDLCHDSDLKHAMANCLEALMGALFLDSSIELADRIFASTLFSEADLHQVWSKLPRHPLQDEEPQGDRHWIKSSAVLRNLVRFEDMTGIDFTNIRLLARAFTPRNLGFNNLTLGHNQRLEFLGDTVLQLIASEYLFKHFPEHHEGHLSLLRSSLVNNRTQSVVCDDLGMTEFVSAQDNAESKSREMKLKEKADLLEAFIGSLYVDKGLKYCHVFCQVCFFPRLRIFIMNQEWNDPKSQLQQCCLTLRELDGGEPDIPIYKVLETAGPTNTRRFTVAVYFRGQRLATGYSHSIQQAEMNAASNALSNKSHLFPQLSHQKNFIEKKYQRAIKTQGSPKVRRTITACGGP